MVSTSLDPDCSGIDRRDIFGRSGDTANRVGGFVVVAGQRWVGPAGCWLNRSGLRRRQTPGTVERRALVSWFPAQLGINHGIKVTPTGNQNRSIKVTSNRRQVCFAGGDVCGAVRRRSVIGLRPTVC